VLLVAAIAGSAVVHYIYRRSTALPEPGSATYEQVTRAFYHGVAALQVGLLDDSRNQFTKATELEAREPAAWANLALAQVRLGELDAAAAPIERALALAPDNSDILLLAGRMESARGRLDEGIALLRRAAQRDMAGVRSLAALAEELERAGGEAFEAEALTVLDQVLQRAPDNLAVIVERARVAARRGDFARLNDSLQRLEPFSAGWAPIAVEQLQNLQRAAAAEAPQDASRASNLLRNVLAREPIFIESLTAVRTPAELIAEPFTRFIALVSPPATPSAPDVSTRFAIESFPGQGGGAAVGTPAAIIAVPLGDSDAPAVFAADGMAVRRLDAEGTWPLAIGTLSGSGLVALDWNHDFRTDIVAAGSGGLRLLVQGADGAFADATPAVPGDTTAQCDCFGAWAADVEMDGDLDIVAGLRNGDPVVLRNNGDGTWRSIQPFSGIQGVRAFAWADLDRDADPDAVFLDMTGALHVFANRQAGDFTRLPIAGAADVAAMTVADIDADGTFDIVTLEMSGVIRRRSLGGDTAGGAAEWDVADLAAWRGLNNPLPGIYRVIAADVDNNGGLDLIVSGPSDSRVWLSDATFEFEPLSASQLGQVFAVADLNGDGRLDLVATVPGDAVPPQPVPPQSVPPQPEPPLDFRARSRPARLINRGTAGYHWKAVRPRAQQTAGDQRINSFGVGGDIEVRSGLLVQKHVIGGPVVHFGLGQQTTIDVARIVWPNGVPQAEFGAAVDDAFVADQRLKGSCPWVFAWDGSGIQFVTDFLWRSPLGLRINAQDTAGVVQTEDWVRIRGDQLAPKDGSYDIRITAELWETHFFDHVSLMAVDHSADTEIYVDERFSAAAPPTYEVHSLRDVTPVGKAWDQSGGEVTDLVNRRDGRHLATFERGRYQGIAKDHFVEFEAARPGQVLLAHGWIYPTDSSINVAIGQGREVQPKPLSLEAQRADGEWVTVQPDLGFPAGKNKTIVIDLKGTAGARRLRLRTNLEIYWDWLAFASPAAAAPRIAKLPLSGADLRYRGFSATSSPRADSPETPDYARLDSTSPRWRDLAGYHTRFGDVRELLQEVDDRYVIMNAGDEMLLRFPEQPAPAAGWRRDFVLVGDGWEKDGDYNTGYSQTVLPLPSHDRPAYGAEKTTPLLEDDPVYQRHRGDWERFHTRYVTPEIFMRGLRLRDDTRKD
jgi:tetratricopeptide (TPR) repeat protein